MAISDKDRKLLWGRSHNRCAFCQQVLSVDARPNDRAAIVGDEAHIVSGAPNGPRSGEPVSSGIDAYENLILLCRNHHKMVDDQPNEFTTQRLLKMKADHETWAEEHFRVAESGIEHTQSQLLHTTDATTVPFHIVTSGVELWSMASSSGLFLFGYGDETQLTEEQQNAIDVLYDYVWDYGIVHGDIEDSGHVAIRDAKRQLETCLTEVHELGVLIYARRIRRVLAGGNAPDQTWMQGDFQAVPFASLVTLIESGVDGSP